MSQKIIRSLYESRLAAWAAARSPALPVEYQNIPFDPAGKPTYLRAFLLPAGTYSEDLAGAHREYLGLFQVTIVAPKAKGAAPAGAIAEELAALFPLNLQLSQAAFKVGIIEPVSEGPAVTTDVSFTLPVSFRYRADTI